MLFQGIHCCSEWWRRLLVVLCRAAIAADAGNVSKADFVAAAKAGLCSHAGLPSGEATSYADLLLKMNKDAWATIAFVFCRWWAFRMPVLNLRRYCFAPVCFASFRVSSVDYMGKQVALFCLRDVSRVVTTYGDQKKNKSICCPFVAIPFSPIIDLGPFDSVLWA